MLCTCAIVFLSYSSLTLFISSASNGSICILCVTFLCGIDMCGVWIDVVVCCIMVSSPSCGRDTFDLMAGIMAFLYNILAMQSPFLIDSGFFTGVVYAYVDWITIGVVNDLGIHSTCHIEW